MGVRETMTFDHIKRGYTSIKMLSPASCPQVRNSLRSRDRLWLRAENFRFAR
jgi:hypothetical protein